MDRNIQPFPDWSEALGLLAVCGGVILVSAIGAIGLRFISDWLDEWWQRRNGRDN